MKYLEIYFEGFHLQPGDVEVDEVIEDFQVVEVVEDFQVVEVVEDFENEKDEEIVADMCPSNDLLPHACIHLHTDFLHIFGVRERNRQLQGDWELDSEVSFLSSLVTSPMILQKYKKKLQI